MGKKYKKNLKKKHIYEELQRIDSGKSEKISSPVITTTTETSSELATEAKEEMSDVIKEVSKEYSVTLPDLKKFLVISLSLVAVLVIVTIFQSKTNFLTSFGDTLFAKIGIFQLQ